MTIIKMLIKKSMNLYRDNVNIKQIDISVFKYPNPQVGL